MKIIFNSMNCGLGNNGGSRTIVRSANTLVELGHIVTIIDTGKNQYTWDKLEAKHLIIKDYKNIPNADVIIATGFKTVKSTLKIPKRCGIKMHWIRGYETWTMPEETIIDTVLKSQTIKIVNSVGLQKKLLSLGVESKIIRPGYDLDELSPDPNIVEEKGDSIILGGLYPHTKHLKIKRTSWVFQTYQKFRDKYKNLQLWMFGNDNIYHTSINNYVQRPSVEQKNNFYNHIDIWLSPGMQEGLHMPPAEAMLTGCPVVGTNDELSGTEDYLVHKKTGLVAESNFESFSTNVETLIINEKLRTRLGKSARLKIRRIGDRKSNMKKMVEYFGEYL